MTIATSQASDSFNQAAEPQKPVADQDNTLLKLQIEADARKAANGHTLVNLGLDHTVLKP